jgi:hypothetical protein
MLKQTKSRPMVAKRKLSRVPFPALTKIRPSTADGTVEGAITAMDWAMTPEEERQSFLRLCEGLGGCVTAVMEMYDLDIG